MIVPWWHTLRDSIQKKVLKEEKSVAKEKEATLQEKEYVIVFEYVIDTKLPMKKVVCMSRPH